MPIRIGSYNIIKYANPGYGSPSGLWICGFDPETLIRFIVYIQIFLSNYRKRSLKVTVTLSGGRMKLHKKIGSFRPLAVELNAADNFVRSLPEVVAL